MKSEQERIDRVSGWYRDEQLDFDKRMIQFRYRCIRPHLVGTRGCEFGPAEGQMTRLLVNDFDSLTVVDAAASLLNLIPDDPKLVKVHSLFEEYEPSSRFDTIVMEHILEHVEFPAELLRRASGWLDKSSSGRIVLGVPNADSFHRLAAVKMGLLSEPCELNARDVSLGHRRVYNRSELRADIESAGLRVVEMGGVFMKPLSNGQIEEHWMDEMIEAFFELGQEFPENAAEIFAVAELA